MTSNGDRYTKLVRLFEQQPASILGGYFLLHTILRAMLGAPPERDEAEQFAISNAYALGYGPHPPLYQWIQTTAFHVFGRNFTALAIVKNTMLFGIYIAIFQLGLLVTGQRRLATIGCFGLFFMESISWTSQIDHTHTVSNTLMVVLTVLVLFKLLQKKSVTLYFLLGLTMGLGLLSKYNYVVFLLAVVVAFALSKNSRSIIMSPGFIMAVMLAFIMASGHYLFILENPEAGLAKVYKLGLGAEDEFAARLTGIYNFVRVFLIQHALWLALAGYAVVLWRSEGRHPVAGLDEPHSDSSDLLVPMWLTIVGVAVLLVVVAGVSKIRPHWLQPEMVFFPLVMAISCASVWTATMHQRFCVAVLALLITIPVAVALKRLTEASRITSPVSALMFHQGIVPVAQAGFVANRSRSVYCSGPTRGIYLVLKEELRSGRDRRKAAAGVGLLPVRFHEA